MSEMNSERGLSKNRIGKETEEKQYGRNGERYHEENQEMGQWPECKKKTDFLWVSDYCPRYDCHQRGSPVHEL